MTPESSTRDGAIDALRVIGVIAGIALHAAVPYMTAPVPGLLWVVHDGSRQPFADLVFWWGRTAQPALFFVVAGMMAMRMRGTLPPAAYAAARVRRLGTALVVGTVFVLPVVGAVWAAGWLDAGRVTAGEVRSWQFADPIVQRNRLGPVHLWFLEDLLLISLAFAAVPRRWLDRATSRVPAVFALLGAAALGAAILALDPGAVVDLRNSFVPAATRVLFGATFFAGGLWLAHRRAASSPLLAIPPLAAAVLGAAYLPSLASEGLTRDAGRLAFAAAVIAATWGSLLGLLHLASHPRLRLSPAVAGIAASSLAIYVLHLPVLGALQLWLATVPLSAAVKFAVVTTGTAAVTWVLARALAARRVLDRAALVPARIWMTAALACGIALRLAHYARTPDVWHDEAALLVNIVERGYRELLEPLTYDQAAPPLFMWALRWIVEHVSDELWALRLPSVVASLAALLLLVPATRVLQARVAPVALVLMAASPRLLWHSAEARPYAMDVAIATALVTAFVVTRAWTLPARVAVFAAATPLVVWASYPAIFAIAGIALALAMLARHDASRGALAALAIFALLIAASFGTLLAGPVSVQRGAPVVPLGADTFPGGWDPLTLAIWLARGAIGVADYCFRPMGVLLVAPMVAGVISLRQRGETPLLVVLLAPVVIAAGAGMAGLYPFTGSRVMIWALPALALLAGEGLGAIIGWMPQRTPAAVAVTVALAIVPPLAFSVPDIFVNWWLPQTFAASRMALAAKGAGDVVASTASEYRYYLRGLSTDFVPLGEREPPARRRVWWLVHGAIAHERGRLAAIAAGAGYRLTSVVDFEGVSVVELSVDR
jgi:surface polysaccharide O-acyltransferase-like enzyme